jgi:hypothetical protein
MTLLANHPAWSERINRSELAAVFHELSVDTLKRREAAEVPQVEKSLMLNMSLRRRGMCLRDAFVHRVWTQLNCPTPDAKNQSVWTENNLNLGRPGRPAASVSRGYRI